MTGLPLRAFLLGVSVGGRTTAGPVALAWTSTGSSAGPARTLAAPLGRAVTSLLFVVEAAADKLPATPARTEPQGLYGRLAVGPASGALLALREGGDAGVASLAGLTGAAAGSLVGVRWRGFCASRGLPDAVAAVAEDLTVAALAWWAARPAPHDGTGDVVGEPPAPPVSGTR